MGLLPLVIMSVWETESHVDDHTYRAGLGKTGGQFLGPRCIRQVASFPRNVGSQKTPKEAPPFP